jgi:hypothetical protein
MKYLNYILIIIGAFVAMYAKVGADQNQYLLIAGIVMLMLGIYRISKTIPSRNNNEADNESENN